eukprot:363314-Chlamydomonas_euryale.AAC.2
MPVRPCASCCTLGDGCLGGGGGGGCRRIPPPRISPPSDTGRSIPVPCLDCTRSARAESVDAISEAPRLPPACKPRPASAASSSSMRPPGSSPLPPRSWLTASAAHWLASPAAVPLGGAARAAPLLACVGVPTGLRSNCCWICRTIDTMSSACCCCCCCCCCICVCAAPPQPGLAVPSGCPAIAAARTDCGMAVLPMYMPVTRPFKSLSGWYHRTDSWRPIRVALLRFSSAACAAACVENVTIAKPAERPERCRGICAAQGNNVLAWWRRCGCCRGEGVARPLIARLLNACLPAALNGCRVRNRLASGHTAPPRQPQGQQQKRDQKAFVQQKPEGVHAAETRRRSCSRNQKAFVQQKPEGQKAFVQHGWVQHSGCSTAAASAQRLQHSGCSSSNSGSAQRLQQQQQRQRTKVAAAATAAARKGFSSSNSGSAQRLPQQRQRQRAEVAAAATASA